MLRRNATIAGIMTIAICTSLINTKVTFATTPTADKGTNFSSDKDGASLVNANEKAIPTTWTAYEGTDFNSDKKCTINNIIFTDTSEGNNHVASVNGNMIKEGGAVELPNSIEVNGTTYSVTSIGEKAFYGCEELTGITIPDSVKSIGKDAFYNCSGLTSITLPDGVTSMEEEVFEGCRGLTNIKIPSSVRSIGKHAFDGCWKLGSMTLPDGVKSIEQGAFYSSGLTNIEIPNSVTNIERYAFYNCGLTSIAIPNSVTSIEESTFERCNSLKSVTIPEGVTNIGQKAFYGCNGLTSIEIPDSVTSVGEKVCADSNITIIKASTQTMNKLTIPDFNKVYFYDEDDSTILGAGYVNLYRSAEGIIEKPTKLGKVFKEWVNTDTASKSKFDDVRSETKFKATYEEAKVTWDNDKKCTIKNITFTDTSDGANNTVSVIGNTMNEEQAVELPKSIKVDGKEYSVTSIGENAFRNCEKLTGLIIPDSVKSIGKGTFFNCSKLKSIKIPDGVTSIEEQQFYGSGLTSITIPNSVTSIGTHAFDSCGELKNMTIPDSVTSIEGGAFYSSGLTSIIIPNSVTSIGRYAFYDCSNLTSITIPKSITSIEEATFYRCNGLTSIEIPDSVTSIGKEAFCGCNGLTSITIPNSVTSIGEGVCRDSNINIIKASESTMENLEIPGFNKVYFYDEDDSTILGAGYVKLYMSAEGLIENPTKSGKAFKEWANKDAESKSKFDTIINETKFKAIYKEATATWDSDKKCTINNITFTDTSNGTNNTVSVKGNTLNEGSIVELPKSIKVDGKEYSVTSIGQEAFYNCKLASIKIPDSVTNIEEDAFKCCRDLKEITLSKGLKDIGNSAFNFCSGLTSIEIPDSVTTIEGSAFYGCSDLKDITIPDSVTSIGKYAFYSCRDLTSITLPDSITSIEEATFSECSRLKDIKLPSKLESIGKNAFNNCNGANFIMLPDTITTVEDGAFSDSTIRRLKVNKSTIDRLDIPGFNKVYFYDEDDSTMLGYGYVQTYMSAEWLAEKPTKPGKTFKEWVNRDTSSDSKFSEVTNETKFKATYSEDIKGKVESALNELKVDNNTTKDDVINQVKASTGVTVNVSDFKKEEATEDKEGYIEGTVNAEENDGSAIAVHFKKVIDKLSNKSSNIEDIIKKTLDNMSVDNDTTEDYIIKKVTTSAGATVTISDFKKKKATKDRNGYIQGTVNAEENDGSAIAVHFKKVIDKLSNNSSNIEDIIKKTLDNMSVDNDTTEDYIIKKVTTSAGVTVTISDFKKEKATKNKNGYIEGTVNAEEEDGSAIDVYFKKVISKLSNNNSSSKHHHHSSSSSSSSSSKATTGNGVSSQPSNKAIELGSMLKTTNDNKIVLTNSWGDKNLRGTVSNVVDKNGDYVGSIITSSESGTAKLQIGNNDVKDLKYIYQYDDITKLFIKVPQAITVDGENIVLPVKKDQTYYVTKSPASDNIVLKEGWNTINGSTYRVEGADLKTGWVLENNTWYYINDTSKARVENNWNLINNKWYVFNEKGEMKTGWHYNGVNWYFLDTTSGDMKTGWKQEGSTWYNLESNGAMSTGWKKVDGSWYYFNSNGSMASNTVIDGYELGANGSLIS